LYFALAILPGYKTPLNLINSVKVCDDLGKAQEVDNRARDFDAGVFLLSSNFY